jgi:hypothetical protein
MSSNLPTTELGRSRSAVTLSVAMSRIEGVVVFAALLGFVVALQTVAGAYASEFGGYADEPAHLVTSLMARDFIASLDFRHPLQFAQQYYYHYPKVAIGHWPPLLYGAMGVWFLVFGASRAAALLFIAILAATTASIVYFIGKHLIGRWAGIFAAVLFVASPVVQEASARLMCEHLSTLGMLVSTLCFARFARTGKVRDGLAFGAVAALALLTHPNAWALALVPALTIALTGRWQLLNRRGLWLSAVPVLIAAVPWYLLTLSMVEDGVGEGAPFLVQGPTFGWYIYAALGSAVLLFALIGSWTTLIRPRRVEVAPEWAALAALAIATFVLHSLIPTGPDGRYMVPLLPSIVLFSAAGIDYMARRFGARGWNEASCIGLAVALLLAFGAERFTLPLQLRNGGYGALVQEVSARVANVPQVWLISSSSTGEGSLVAAVALREAHPDSYVLRGKTILAGGDWMWNNTEDRFDTPAKLAGLLDEIPVTIVVIDDLIPPIERRPYQARLKKLLADDNGRWDPIGSYPQMHDGIVYANSLHVYARHPVAALSIAAPMVRLDRLKALMVRSELR